MARTTATAQAAALAALDRTTHVRVEVEGPDGHFVDLTDFLDEDFLDAVVIEAGVDEPVGAATIRLRRDVIDSDGSLLSLSPLMEGSRANVDSLGAYAPAIDASRRVNVYVDVTEPGAAPDWQWLFEGRIDDPEFGGIESRLMLDARDPMGRMNDTIIETTSTYGGGSPLEPIEDVMQAILNDVMGSGEYPLTVVGAPDFGIEEYDLGNVSVLDALRALADLQGWLLHWKWLESPAEFGLVYYEPTRDAASLSGYTPDHTLGPDDYFDVTELRLDSSGIRNAGEVIYTDSAGDDQTVSEERSTSVALHGTRFIRVDARGSSITTNQQATALLSAILDDLEGPLAQQVVECPFLWNVELGDTVRFTTNDVHYDSSQDWAIVGYRHELSFDRRRTILTVAGKPSGGYRRWLLKDGSESRDLPQVEELTARLTTSGALSANVRTTRDVRSVRVAAGTSAPTRAAVEAKTAQAVAQGVVDVTGLGGFAASDEVHVAVIAYASSDGSDRGSDVYRYQTSGTSLQAGNTDAVDNAASAQVARLAQGETVFGGDFSGGEANVVFSPAYASAPLLLLLGFHTKTYEAGDSGVDQSLLIQFVDVDTDGATIRALLKTGTTTTPDGDDFTASSDLDSAAETVECNLGSLAAAGADGDAYTIHYSFAMQITELAGGTYQVSVTLAFDSNDGGGWVERATRTFNLSAVNFGSDSNNLTHVTQLITVSGLTTNDDIRIRVKSINETGTGTIDSLSAHGFNAATNGDPAEGVTWEENTGGASASAVPDAAHFVTYQAMEVAG